jgi:uncharacterized OB-fold protein
MTRVLPDLEDAEFAPFFDGLRKHELRVQRCAACQELRWPPRPVCGGCGDDALEWVAVPRRGRLYSWVTIWRVAAPELKAEVPFDVAVVALDADPRLRMLGRVEPSPGRELAIEAPMDVVFHAVTDVVTLAYWRLA